MGQEPWPTRMGQDGVGWQDAVDLLLEANGAHFHVDLVMVVHKEMSRGERSEEWSSLPCADSSNLKQTAFSGPDSAEKAK
jgi:hypothetical protein